MLKDADFLGLVEKHQGVTVEQIGIGEGKMVTLLISKALAPLPIHLDLPNGKMELLVATVITEDEMRWSMANGRNNLLDKLKKAGVGQVSVLDRSSVICIEEPDFALVASLDQAKALAAKGQLAKLLMFPAEFGGGRCGDECPLRPAKDDQAADSTHTNAPSMDSGRRGK